MDHLEHLSPSRFRVTIAMSLALLIGGCDANQPAGGAGGSTGGATSGGGGAGGVGQAAGGTAGQDPGIPRCENERLRISWSLTPAVAQLSGMVVRKETGTGGSEAFAIAAAGGTEHTLTLDASLSAPIAVGDQIDIRTATLSLFVIYRTLEIRKEGDVVVYATAIEQANLAPPLRLEAGDQECATRFVPTPGIILHKLVAYDGDQPTIIEVGQQADVGRFRVFNDSIVRYPSPVLDSIDTFHVVLVRVR